MKKLFKDKKVTIMGLGLHGGGVGVAKFFCQQGAKVLVTDLKTESQLTESIKKLKKFQIEYVLGSHRQKDFIETDLIIKNPGVPNNSPYLKIAETSRVPVKNDIDIFFDLCKAPIIGITGTKGKSTVATLIYLFLKTKYSNTILAGNIGVSPLEVLSKINQKSRVVLELSSFELEGLKKSPPMAVFTNILPDHLNRYKNLEEYIESKKPIFKHQKKSDILILNYDDFVIRKFSIESQSQNYFYSQKFLPDNKKNKKIVCFLKNNIVFFDGEEICRLEEVKLKGKHNISNVLAGILAAKLLKVPSENIRKVLKKFTGVEFRQELIKEINGVKYFNDTTATMPDAVIQVISSFSQQFPGSNIVLIAGGGDKGLDYKNLAKEIKKTIKNLVLLPGTASKKIKEELAKQNKKLEIYEVSNMKKAVKEAAFLAKEGDIVLLSPGAASFNIFENEFDRGRQFNKFVKELLENINQINAQKL